MAVKDEWVRAAMKDDNVVAEFLLRLKQAEAAIPAVTTLKWGVRQLRSTRCGAKRDGDFSTRCSPNTPLSWWSGGASPSAADGFEATSRPPPSRSKGAAAAVNEGIKSTSKRKRRKKTCAQLKEEENLLLKERIHLQEEIAWMQATCEEQRARNEHLKRIKLHLDLRIAKKGGETEKVLPCRSVPSDRQPDVACFVLPDLNMVPGEDERGFIWK